MSYVMMKVIQLRRHVSVSTSSVYVYNGCLAWYDVLLNSGITQA